MARRYHNANTMPLRRGRNLANRNTPMSAERSGDFTVNNTMQANRNEPMSRRTGNYSMNSDLNRRSDYHSFNDGHGNRNSPATHRNGNYSFNNDVYGSRGDGRHSRNDGFDNRRNDNRSFGNGYGFDNRRNDGFDNRRNDGRSFDNGYGFNGDYSYSEENGRRTAAMEDGGMIREDRTKIANLPQNVMFNRYPTNSFYLPEQLEDSIYGIDEQINVDVYKRNINLRPRKV